MTFNVVVTEQAAREIETAAAWWATERSVEQAECWYAGIRQAIKTLDKHPDRCPKAAEDGAFPYALRELHCGLGSRPTHRAIFTTVKQTVVVLTVRHVARDQIRPGEL